MEKEPKIDSYENQQVKNLERLVKSLDISTNGYFGLSVSPESSSEELVKIIRKNIPDCKIDTFRAEEEKYGSEESTNFLQWLYTLAGSSPDSLTDKEKGIFIIDLSRISSIGTISSYFAEMNMKRDKIATNPNGPFLVITQHLNKDTEREIYSKSDLRSTCLGHYEI